MNFASRAVCVLLASTGPLVTGQVLDETVKLTAEDGASSQRFGNAVGVDGGIAIIGAPGGTPLGSAYLFDVATGQQIGRLVPDGGTIGGEFGTAVALDGSDALVGAQYADRDGVVNCGLAYGFNVWDPAAPVQNGLLAAHAQQYNDRFGFSVDVDSGMAIVGAPLASLLNQQAGAAYLFVTGTWSRFANIGLSECSQFDMFGNAVSLGGGFSVVGAPLHDNLTGVAYVFHGPTGTFIARLQPDDATPGVLFGSSVAIDGLRTIVGAPRADGLTGAVYHYESVTGQLVRKLLAADGAPGDRFGEAVAVDGSLAVVGAFRDGDDGESSGSAYVFDLTTGQQIAKLLPSDNDWSAEFGTSVSISGDIIVVGAPYAFVDGQDTGAAYVFDLTPPAPCNPADLARPFGFHDLADITTFVGAFVASDPAADLDGSGILDLADIVAFVTEFRAGCP